MALNPNYLDSLPNSLVEMYSLVEIDILEDMARRISTYDYFIPAALHQNQKLQELGMVQEHIIQALSAITGQTQQEIVNLLTEASEEAVADDVEYYKRADVYKPTEINSEALHKQLNSGLLQTQQAFKNITRTTANTATKQFENALDRAWTQIMSGGMDYNTAIDRAIKDLSKQGIGSIAYKSGRVDTIEVAVRRAVVTGVNQTAGKIQEALADELDVDLVEVTAHGGARPEHAKWQGKCYSRKGRQVIDGVVYEDFEKATRYGHGDGLKGWNCHHDFHPYIHGAPRTWTDKELKKLEEKKITYNGKKYTEYEASQKQREIERDIRSLKRQVAAIEAGGGDASAERSKLNKANKAYSDFTEQTGLKKQQARTKIGSEQAQKDVDKAYKTANVNTPSKKEIQEQRKENLKEINAQKRKELISVYGDESTFRDYAFDKDKETLEALDNGIDIEAETIKAYSKFKDVTSESVARHSKALRDLQHEESTIFDADGNVIMHKKGAETSVNFSGSEQQRLKGQNLTHNHPTNSQRASIFSEQDIQFADKVGLESITTVNSEGTIRTLYKDKYFVPKDVDHLSTNLSEAYGRVRKFDGAEAAEEFLIKNAESYGYKYHLQPSSSDEKAVEISEKFATTPLTNTVKSDKLNSRADPMAEVYGSGETSHPVEIKQYRDELKKLGVRLIEREEESLGYTPALKSGEPGTAYVSKGASYSAWTHEMQHMRDDEAAGWLGMKILADPDKRYAWEEKAYNIEIEMAIKAGREDIAQRLRENLEKERKEIYGE